MIIKFFSRGCFMLFVVILIIALYTAYKIYNVVKPILYEKFKGIELLEPERNFKDYIDKVKDKKFRDSLLVYYKKVEQLSFEKKEVVLTSFNRTFNVLNLNKKIDSLEAEDLLKLLRTLTRE